jgi:DnaK suppressor protein
MSYGRYISSPRKQGGRKKRTGEAHQRTYGESMPDKKNSRVASSSSEKKNGHSMAAVVDPKGYRPNEKEPFMNDRQREYFRNKLLAWKEDILKEAKETLAHLQAENENHPDLADRASSETDRAIELRARDRQRKLIAKIDAALSRIDDGTYGFCEETGEPIALRRLEARPIATLSIEAQERHERRERVYRDD